jgi:hypothetical protein
MPTEVQRFVETHIVEQLDYAGNLCWENLQWRGYIGNYPISREFHWQTFTMERKES